MRQITHSIKPAKNFSIFKGNDSLSIECFRILPGLICQETGLVTEEKIVIMQETAMKVAPDPMLFPKTIY